MWRKKPGFRPRPDGRRRGRASQKQSKASEKVLMTLLMGLSMILGVALAVGLFFFLPTVLFNLATGAAPAMHENAILRAVFEGVLRIVIFVVYWRWFHSLRISSRGIPVSRGGAQDDFSVMSRGRS